MSPTGINFGRRSDADPDSQGGAVRGQGRVRAAAAAAGHRRAGHRLRRQPDQLAEHAGVQQRSACVGQMEGSIAWHSPTTENPALDSTEEWEIWNVTGDAHPVHLHLVHFEILGRRRSVGPQRDEDGSSPTVHGRRRRDLPGPSRRCSTTPSPGSGTYGRLPIVNPRRCRRPQPPSTSRTRRRTW